MTNVQQYITASFEESVAVKNESLDSCRKDIERAVEIIVHSYRQQGKLLLCGNGGSASDAQHLATELMIRLSHDIHRKALGAISLMTDCSNMTAGGNDIGFENVMSRNVEGLGRPGDVLVGISTSGNSPNVVKALQMAKSLNMKTIGFLGSGGGKMRSLCDVPIIVPSSNIQRIQECHILIGHTICELVEKILFGGE